MALFDEVQFNLLTQNGIKPVVAQQEPQEGAVVTVPMAGDSKPSAVVNQPVPNSVVASEQPQTAAKLTKEGNVPIVTSPVRSEETGLKVEKSTNAETTQPKTNNNAPKSKRTIDEAMGESYKKLGWDKMTEDQKQEQIIKHITTVDKKQFNYLATKNQPDGRIGWLKSFLLNERMDEKQSRLVIGALKKLNVSKEEFAELQSQGVKMAFDDDNRNQKACQLQVAEDMGAYGKKAQKVAIEKTSTSKFDEVKVAGSLSASKVDETLQEFAVKQYMEGSKTSSLEIQKQIGFNLVDQYGQYAKDAEVNIHRIISTSNPAVSEIVEYAASNIWKFDKENQAPAVQITAETGNEKAINAAAAQWSKYDESAQGAIASIVSSTPYESAHKTLASAQQSATNPAVSDSSRPSVSVSSVVAQPLFVPISNVQVKKIRANNETFINAAARKIKSFVLSFGLKTEKTESVQEPKTLEQQEKSGTIQEKIQKVIDGKADIAKLSSKELSEMVKKLDQLPSAQREKLVLMLVKSNPKLVLSILPSLDKGIHSKIMAELDTYSFVKYKQNINYSVLSQDSKKRYEEMENKA